MLSAQGTKQTSVSWAVLYNLCWAQCSARTFPLMFHLSLHKYTVLKDTPGQTSDGEVEAEPMLSFFLNFSSAFLVLCLSPSSALWSLM